MKIVQFSAFGMPHEVAGCVEAPDPEPPADDEVTVAIEAFPINPADLLTLRGEYAVRPPLPTTPGAEAVGRVTAVGTHVSHVGQGDRVLLLSRENWVQQRTLEGAQVLKLPDGADVLQLAMLKVNPATAHFMLNDYVALAPGDWVVQDAANSGVGVCLVRLAAAQGVKCACVVRRESAVADLEALGAEVVLVDGRDLAQRLLAATGGARPKLAIDAIGGAICLRLGDCLAEGGTLVNYGMLSGEPCLLSPHQIVFRRLTLTGFWLAPKFVELSREDLAALYGDLAARVVDGTLRVPIEATYPIEDIGAALEHAERGGRSGKILVTPNGLG